MGTITSGFIRNILLAAFVALVGMQGRCVEVDGKSVVSVGKFLFRIADGPAQGEAWLVGVKDGVTLEGEISLPGSATVNGTRYVVTRIGDNIGARWFVYEPAIKDFPLITRVTIPSTVQEINSMEFMGCKGIAEFHVNSANQRFKDENGLLYYRSGVGDDYLWNFFRMPPATKKTRFTVPEDVGYVWDNAFADNKTIKTLVLQNRNTLKPDWAGGNLGIREFVVTNSLKYTVMDGLLYYGWDNISFNRLVACPPALQAESLTIPSSVTEIFSGAFTNTVIPQIYIPPSVRLIGANAFHNAQITTLSYDADLLNGNLTGMCVGCEKLHTVEITGDKSKHAKIYEAQFLGCVNLANLSIASTQIEIDGRAFYGCESLKSFPFDRVARIEGSVGADPRDREVEHFAYSGVEEATIPACCDGIPPGMFRGSALRKVAMNVEDHNLEYIYGNAFRDCHLTEVNLPHVVLMEEGSFAGNPLKKVVIPSRIDSRLVNIDAAFSGSATTWYYLAQDDIAWSGQPEAGIYVTANYAGQSNVPDDWTMLYCPARAAANFEGCDKSKIVEMFTIEMVGHKSGFIVRQSEAASNLGFRINGVDIGTRPTFLEGDDLWRLSYGGEVRTQSLTINFSVDGVEMRTYYPAGTFSDEAGVESTAGDTFQNEVESVCTIGGVPLSSEADGAADGVVVVRYSDGTSAKVIRK